jgi:hypothetical protein
MSAEDHVGFLRGSGNNATLEEHPILQLTDEELRRAIGGIDGAVGSSGMTGSYDATEFPKMCCDGVKVCCCVEPD